MGISKEEIEKAKDDIKALRNRYLSVDYSSPLSQTNLKNLDFLFQYIDELEQENKKLNKKEFERKSDERINIQEIKYIDELEHGVMGTYIGENKKVINKLIKAVKQLDEELKSNKNLFRNRGFSTVETVLRELEYVKNERDEYKGYYESTYKRFRHLIKSKFIEKYDQFDFKKRRVQIRYKRS